MRRNLTYPKDEDTLRENNKQLRSLVKRLRKENEMLRNQLSGTSKIQKSEKVKNVAVKEPIEKYEDPTAARTEWRKEFIRKFKPKTIKDTK